MSVSLCGYEHWTGLKYITVRFQIPRNTELSEKDTEEENLFRRQNQKDTQLRKQACQSLSVQTKEERRVSHN